MSKNRFIIKGLFVLSVFYVNSLIAAEAYTPIAYGVKSLGMGGVGIATLQGAESGMENPALLSYLKNNELSLGVTATRYDQDISNYPEIKMDYDPDYTYVPYMAVNYKLNENFSMGLSVSQFKIGNKVTYITTDGNNTTGGIYSSIKKTRVVLPLSYKLNNLSFGISLVSEKEEYALHALEDDGMNQDFSSTDYGYMCGLAYQFPQENVLIALNYKSRIKHEFYNSDEEHYFHLSSASELGVGVHWKINNTNSSLAVDYKRVKGSQVYSKSEPTTWYEDQDVFAIGYSYDVEKWSLRAGYRYVDSLYGYDLLSAWYPYDSKSHYTIGGTYFINRSFSTDVALVYASYSRTMKENDADLNNDSTSLALSINYNF